MNRYSNNVDYMRRSGRTALFLMLIVVSSFGVLSCNPPPTSEGKTQNVFLIITCSLRRDRLGCYGYPRKTSPNIDNLARQGAIFNNCITQAPFTKRSYASIITAKYPRNIAFPLFPFRLLGDENLTLAEILSAEGYQTICFSTNPWISKYFNFQQGFGQFFDTTGSFHISKKNPEENVKKEKIDGREITDAVLEILDNGKTARKFFTLIYTDVHYPYKKEFSPQAILPDWYDQMVEYLDSQIGRLIEGLRERKILENSLIVLVSDHGEAFKEFHEFDQGHGFFLYNTVVRVPLIFYGKSVRENLRVDATVPALHITPTILDLLDIPLPPEEFDGKSLKPVLLGKEESTSSEEIIIIETNFDFKYKLRKIAIVYQGRWKYIKNFDDHYRGNPYQQELYDLISDPTEQDNLVQKEPQLTGKLQVMVDEWIKRKQKRPASVQIKKKWGMRKQEINRQLRSMGYVN